MRRAATTTPAELLVQRRLIGRGILAEAGIGLSGGGGGLLWVRRTARRPW
jgi:hypothetical protein